MLLFSELLNCHSMLAQNYITQLLIKADHLMSYFLLITRMWANAQRDGRPAEYRWRSLFNAAKFG